MSSEHILNPTGGLFAVAFRGKPGKGGNRVKSWSVFWAACMMVVCSYGVPEAWCETVPVRLPITIDLPLFDAPYQSATKRFLASMRPEQPVLTTDGLLVNILAEAETTGQVREEQTDPTASPDALAKVMELWQTWDALLIHLISQFSGQPLTDDYRYCLMDTLLGLGMPLEILMPEDQSIPPPPPEETSPTSLHHSPADWRIWSFPGCSRAWAV